MKAAEEAAREAAEAFDAAEAELQACKERLLGNGKEANSAGVGLLDLPTEVGPEHQ